MYVLQDMESDKEIVYYDTVYSNNDYTPEQRNQLGIGGNGHIN